MALLSVADQHHAACLEASKSLRGPFYTAWPVLTEAVFLLRDRPEAVEKLLDRVRHSMLRLLELASDGIDGIRQILADYADQGFDLADASLMYLAEREGIDSVFTIDYRPFSVFRTGKGKPLKLAPWPM